MRRVIRRPGRCWVGRRFWIRSGSYRWALKEVSNATLGALSSEAAGTSHFHLAEPSATIGLRRAKKRFEGTSTIVLINKWEKLWFVVVLLDLDILESIGLFDFIERIAVKNVVATFPECEGEVV